MTAARTVVRRGICLAGQARKDAARRRRNENATSGFVPYPVVVSGMVVDQQDLEVACCAIGLVARETSGTSIVGFVGGSVFTCRPAQISIDGSVTAVDATEMMMRSSWPRPRLVRHRRRSPAQLRRLPRQWSELAAPTCRLMSVTRPRRGLLHSGPRERR